MTCNGCDIDLIPRDSSYASLPDLRETRHSGDVLDCVLKEYDSRAGTLSISVKETEPEPFDGAEFRRLEGPTREAVISGKYGGGFRTLPDNVTVMCNLCTTTPHSKSATAFSCRFSVTKRAKSRPTVKSWPTGNGIETARVGQASPLWREARPRSSENKRVSNSFNGDTFRLLASVFNLSLMVVS
ncbi:MAG: hypothetical protein IJQ81_15180 [Oscillibacter sp.]|nr:hypothetical protein [Oscillibacter sp.]